MNTTVNAILVHAKQTLVNYRKPSSYLLKETYPLPPYSTVIGMVHKACDYKEYHPMKISVQGDINATISDLYTRYTFNGSSYDETRHQICIEEDGKTYGIFRGIAYTELITEIELYIHIVPENEEEIQFIYESLKRPKTYLALGRHEDLLDIIEVSKVVCENKEIAISEHDMYVPKNLVLPTVYGTSYRLNKEFYIDSKTNLRKFKLPIFAKLIAKGEELNDCYVDENGLPVVLV